MNNVKGNTVEKISWNKMTKNLNFLKIKDINSWKRSF